MSNHMQDRLNVELVAAGYAQIKGRKRDNNRTGKAGFGCTLRCIRAVKVIHGDLQTKSEIRAELMGVVAGLKRLRNPGAVQIYTANSYLMQDLRKVLREVARTLRIEQKFGLKTTCWVPERNADLWRELVNIAKALDISVHSTERKADRDYDLALRAAKAGVFGAGERKIEHPGRHRNFA